TIKGVGVREQVAELGERVAAHARNWRAAGGVLRHEIVDNLGGEAVLEIEDVVRDAESMRDRARVVDRVERAAGTVGDFLAVTEQLHRGADHLVALLDQQGSGQRRIHPAAHRDEDLAPLTHGRGRPRAPSPGRPPTGTPRPRGRSPPRWSRDPARIAEWWALAAPRAPSRPARATAPPSRSRTPSPQIRRCPPGPAASAAPRPRRR